MVNILSHVDKSASEQTKGFSKAERYKWKTIGEIGEFRLIDKRHLNIDGRYQREEVSSSKVMTIARDWDWAMFGTLCVIERPDDTLWVFDGGHRARASFYRADIVQLPCMVHQMSTVSDEAKSFVNRNTMISNVSSFDRYRALTCAEDSCAITVSRILDECGLTVGKSAQAPHMFSAIGTLVSAVKEDEAIARKSMVFCCQILRESAISGHVLTGVFTLQRHFVAKGIDILAEHGEKIRSYSMKEIEIRIRQLRAETGKGGSTTFAKAILELINKSKKNKIEW
jgi:hypothetical protein